MRHQLEDLKVSEVISATATGTTTINSAEVDTAGYDGVIFVTSLGTANAGNGHKVQQDTVTGMAGAADLLGSQVLCNGTGKVLVTYVHRPQERFVRCAVIRAGATTTINNCSAILVGARRTPQTNTVTNAVASEQLFSPAEGTA